MIEAPRITEDARPDRRLELLWSPASPAIQVASALDRVRRAPTILDALRTVGQLLPVVDSGVHAGIDAHALLEPIVEAMHDETDTLTALAAVHALARVPGPKASLLLADRITDGAPGFIEHALWASSARPVSQLLVWPLARAIAPGGLAGLHAQRALATWAMTDPKLVLEGLRSVLDETAVPSARRYLVETIGLVPGSAASHALAQVAMDASETVSTRRAAIEAFVDRSNEPLPSNLAGLDEGLEHVVRSVRGQRQLRHRPPRPRSGGGLRVAQVHLGHAGGLATLLPQLGDALAGQRRVTELLTIMRDGVPLPTSGPCQRIETVALEDGDGAGFGEGWPAVVSAARGIRMAMLAGPVPDVVHLRMADPGTLAAADVAESLGIPIVFTLAPDPHAPIEAAEAHGTLDRRTFAGHDARAALWFRARLVERIAQRARELVVFPRQRQQRSLDELTGVDLTTGRPRHTVVAEGIDLGRIDRAATSVTDAAGAPSVLLELQAAIGRLPRARHGLPLVVSAGRMIELKGMARLVEAFAQDDALAARANLVLIGGDLTRPGAAEAAELARIDASFRRYPGLRERVVLLGQRPHTDVALVLAAARHGWRSLIGARGSYACASSKEEFGLAIVEALASGLPVTAPISGGPATYVEPGRTGVLVETSDPAAIAAGIGRVLDLASDPGTADRTRQLVEARYTIERMARSLAAVYRITAGAASLADVEANPATGAA